MTSPPPRLLHRLIDLLIRQRALVMLAALAATAAAIFPASRLQFDQSIESLFSQKNPRLADHVESRRLFGGDEFVIVAYTDPKLLSLADHNLTPAAQKQIEEFAARLAKVPGVTSMQDLASSLSITSYPFLARRRDKLLELFRGILVGDDNQTTAVVLRIGSGRDVEFDAGEKVSRAKTIASIRKIAEEHNPPAWVVGEPVQVHDMFRYVEQDGRVLGLASSGLLTLVILVLFRSLRWMLLPLLVVHVTLLWTKAILVVSQLQLSMVSSMLDSLVTIIGVATVIHVTVHFRDLRARLDRVAALRETLILLAPAIFWTCATTAGGFAAQISSHIHPVQSFGIMMALGSMLVLVAAAVVLPGGALLGNAGVDPHASPAADHLGRALGRITDWVERHPFKLGIACLVVLLITLGGFFRLRVETDFSKNFRESSPIVQSLEFVETHLGGAGTWEVNFPAPHELTPEFLAQVRRLATSLRALKSGESASSAGHDSLTKVVAITDGIDLIPRIPLFTPNLALAGQLRVLNGFQPEFVPSLYNPEGGRMRIVLRARERQESEDKLRLIAAVESTTREVFPDAKATGLFVLLTFLIESLMGDQWVSFVLAGTGIAGMMTVAYRSLRIGLISLVPNVFPIIVVIGTMGWVGLPINIATAMIASVSMGLTVDSSIHYLSGYDRARRRGLDFYAALRETHQGVGSALVYANLALITGFLVLTLSHFIPLIYFGILVSVAMLGGLAGNLVLLPLLMRIARVGGPQERRRP